MGPPVTSAGKPKLIRRLQRARAFAPRDPLKKRGKERRRAFPEHVCSRKARSRPCPIPPPVGCGGGRDRERPQTPATKWSQSVDACWVFPWDWRSHGHQLRRYPCGSSHLPAKGWSPRWVKGRGMELNPPFLCKKKGRESYPHPSEEKGGIPPRPPFRGGGGSPPPLPSCLNLKCECEVECELEQT